MNPARRAAPTAPPAPSRVGLRAGHKTSRRRGTHQCSLAGIDSGPTLQTSRRRCNRLDAGWILSCRVAGQPKSRIEPGRFRPAAKTVFHTIRARLCVNPPIAPPLRVVLEMIR